MGLKPHNANLEELRFCLKLWEEQGYCEFGGHTNCSECAAPYLLYKSITGEVLHGRDMKRLTLEDWKKKCADVSKDYIQITR